MRVKLKEIHGDLRESYKLTEDLDNFTTGKKYFLHDFKTVRINDTELTQAKATNDLGFEQKILVFNFKFIGWEYEKVERKKVFFKDLKDGEMALIVGGAKDAYNGRVVVKVGFQSRVQALGEGSYWVGIDSNKLEVVKLISGDILELD